MNLFSKKKQDEILVITLDDNSCRLQHFKQAEGKLQHLASGQFNYTSHANYHDQLLNWCKNLPGGPIACRIVLSRNLYQTHLVDPPNVLAKELAEALKWQIKDLIDQPIDKVLVTHYQPSMAESQNNQIIAVVTNRNMVEELIDSCRQAGLLLESIDIEELTLGHALLTYLDNDKIIGFIGEDNSGLVFNFYSKGGLVFSRHKKGRFLPNQQREEFSLEQDNQAEQDSFLLETQRTLDYVVSQIFRRPIDKILLQQNSGDDDSLAVLIKQITELDVSLVTSVIEQTDPQLPPASLVEVGAAMAEGH